MTMRYVVAVIAMCSVILAGCTKSVGPAEGANPAIVPLPPGPYVEVSWASSDMIAAVSYTDPTGTKLELFDTQGARLGSVPLDDSEVCAIRSVLGLSRLPGGGIAFTDRCQRPAGAGLPTFVGHVYAFNPATSQRRELPRTVGIPTRMAWSADSSELVYGVGTPLCETLYRWTATSDGPLAVGVEIAGETVRLGEDITDVEGACPFSGQASSPAINQSDGTLATFVQPSAGMSGQDRVDLPWSLVIVFGDTAQPVLGNIAYPCCVAWTSSGDLIFSGVIDGQNGLYRVHRDGTDLERIGSVGLEYLSLSADGSTVIGVRTPSFPPPDDPTHTPVPILRYQLSGISG